MTPGSAAALYIERWIDGTIADENERAECCDLIATQAVTNHQRGIWHIALVTEVPFVILRAEIGKQLAVRAAIAHVQIHSAKEAPATTDNAQ